MPKVSVIIPCFNLGRYIQEAIDSVTAQTFQDFEIIVVNDGSTEPETIEILSQLDAPPQTRIIHIENQGLPCARNTGIAQANGEYILPLDADDKIADTYLQKAVRILEEDNNIGIVYCLAEFFGMENFKWDLPAFELPRMLIDNLIFCSAFFRKSDWEKVGGYKSKMIYGWEDYDFWLSIIELNRKVYRIQEYLFFYRRREESMTNSITQEKTFQIYKEIFNNHRELYAENIDHLFKYIYKLREEISEFEKERVAKDTKIHHLNLETADLTNKLHAEKNHSLDLADKLAGKNYSLKDILEILLKSSKVRKVRDRLFTKK